MGGKGSWQGKSGKGRSWGKKGGAAAAAKKDWARKVPWNDRLSKYYLRPYVDQGGSPFVTGNMTEKDMLSAWHLSGVLNESCSEYCARQGIALSEGAANLEAGAQLLQHHFTEGVDLALKKLGIEDFVNGLETDDGKKFLEACHYLNTAQEEVERSEEATGKAIKRFLRFLTTEPNKKEATFRKMLRFATRLHLFAMEGLEAVTALTHPKVMAAGVRQVGQELNLPGDVKAWLKAPEDQEALVWSLVAAFHQQKLAGSKKRSAGSLDWDAEEEEEAPAPGKGQDRRRSRYGEDDDEEEDAPRPAAAGKGEGKKGGGRKRAKTGAEALASDDEGKGPDEMNLDLDSSGEEAEPPADIWKEWSADKVTELKNLLAEVETKDPKERPAFPDLLTALAAVPEVGLEAAGLKKTVQELRKKTRYPKAANLKKLIEALQGMVAQAEKARAGSSEWTHFKGSAICKKPQNV